eukprot:CAMPEP_0201717064 /NCGR_PEP_ID=MMETSP0593-20130828/2894_1 /ASSEMBLY_ACC=CAM_ASM_000672 /TAXON_ID=267983 /ORGANISM="Skeletonema japonicum, Strain CCMP2506" /LENGTH=448 /DNA_ID=CAMNT_0048207029 /DNA_START=20 /DNA_END=1366 /DNA_ORIENTATION=+
MTTRVPLSTNEILSPPPPPSSDNRDAYYAKIPILKRRASKSTKKDPTCVIVVGMAGSGKTTLMAQLQKSLNLRDAADDKEDGDNTTTTTTATSSTKSTNNRAGYAINLDPAAKYVPFTSSIDIRDTVDYIEVMRQHKLGPNGAILTCLNLFATKFDQVMAILERRSFPLEKNELNSVGEEEEEGQASEGLGDDSNDNSSTDNETQQQQQKSEDNDNDDNTAQAASNTNSSNDNSSNNTAPLDYILIDTPGQIEAFTWSASGTIVTSALATTFPTVLAFVIDTPRCAASVHTFMSNMLYACSMLYRAKLPMVIVLNKIDIVGCEFVKEWMEDYESFQEALDDASEMNNGYSDEMAGGGGSSGYYASLTRSLSLVLDEFYNHLHKVGVSAATGEGVEEFWTVVDQAAEEYEEGYLVDLKNRVEEQMAKERAMQRVGARKLVRDLQEDGQL